MGDTKLFVLLVLYTIVFTDAQDDEAFCLLAKRYKSFHKYVYHYETESLNTLNGAINGPKINCKVEIEVPGTCHFIVHTKECTLSEVISVDGDGNPVFGPSAGAGTFKAQMEKNPIKVIVEGKNDIKLFTEDDELINILNIKRGIISALAVPVLQEEMNKKLPTIYGLCKTDYTVNAREDIATDVTLNRDLSKCDQFRPIKDHTSPLAIITGMHYPLAQLIRSKQTCSYKFDNAQKHMTSGVCTENHLLVPFSYKGKYGVTSVGKQSLSLLGVTEYNERVFHHKEANMKTLHLDESIDKSPNQDDNSILDVLRELSGLSHTANGQKRAHLAYKLVAVIRKMNADTLSAALPKALEISRSLTYQALFQCGTPECSGALMQGLRTSKSSSTEIDAAVYAIGLVPNPSRVLLKEMLEMAKFKPSKLIYYATSNAVRRLYNAEGRVTPEIQAVADYALENIGECTGDQEHIYLTLRVIGNMAEAVGAARPALKSAVIQCINQPAASTKVQQAAIQVFRLTPIPEEGRKVLMHVVLDGAAPVQKRIAAYLILLKDPQPAELEKLTAALPGEENQQIKSFVISHLTNILSSTAQETNELRQKILDALQGNEVGNVMDSTTFSRNYKIGSLEGNIIFDKENNLPTEVMIEMTLDSFGYDIEMVEVGMEGKGLEPTVEALFGANGFFPDTVMKTIYYATDEMPNQVNEILKTMIPALNDKKKGQVPKNIIREIAKNIDKLIKNLKSQEAPEAMIYLRLLGAELGYLQTKDIEDLANSVTTVAENLMRLFPVGIAKSLFSRVDNELFLHYLFMDNEFYLPTGPGFPLRVALSGTFTPGVIGGLRISPDMSEIAFMPSASVEFVTEIGSHFPDYVQSHLELHTNIYQERSLRAKVSITHSQIKLSIPAPKNPVKVLSVSNSIVSVTGDKTKSIPATMKPVDVNQCQPLFLGMKYCIALQYSNAMVNDASPYFPLSGDSKFAFELHPTADVSEYTATINYAYEENTDKVTFDVKAEGTTFEATSKVMFNRKENTASAELKIPDYDIEAGIRIGTAGPSTKIKGTRSIQIDFINKNILQASLVGLAKLNSMKDVLLQVQLLVPSLEADGKLTATLKREEELKLELKSDLKIFDASAVQKLTLKYDDKKVEAQIKSKLSSKTQKIISKLGTMKEDIRSFLNQHIGQTKIELCDVLASSIETTNSYLEASKIPFVENLRVPSLPEFEVPEKLFFYIEADAKYHFGKHYYTITLPLPLGGKSSIANLNFPRALTTPSLTVPQLGLNIASIKVPLPEVIFPETLSLSLPTIGKAEMTGKLNSNLYDLEATVSAGKDIDEHQSYSARVGVTASGPVDLLSFRIEGSALISGIMTDTLRAKVSTSVKHKLIDARINIDEEIQLMEKISTKSSCMLEASKPFNLKFSLEHSGQMFVDIREISGDSHLKGSFVTGPIDGNITLTQSLALFPLSTVARMNSTLEITSDHFQAQNKFVASLINGELSVVSNSAALGDMLTHSAEVTLIGSTCALKSNTKVLGLTIHNSAEATIGDKDSSIKIETTSRHSEDHMNSLIIATLNGNSLVVNSDASMKLAEHTATHKGSVTLDKNGLATSGTTSLNSLLTLTNTFSSILHSSKFLLSSETKGNFNDMAIDNANTISATMSSIDLTSKSRVDLAQGIWYINDISVQAKPYTATTGMTSHLKLASDIELKNSCEIKLADLTGNAKCSTTGKLIGARMSHDTEMEICRHGVRINNDADFKSQLAHFSTTLQATATLFTFNLHALAVGDGELHLYGKHSAQVYTKVHLSAQPLALAHSHECRFSTRHELNNDVIFEANFDKKFDTQLSPSEQSVSLIVKSTMNNKAISQEVRAYNNHERIGFEVSGVVTYRESKDLSISALMQYEKNTENHVINLPFLESLIPLLEKLKLISVTLVEELHNYMKSEEFIVRIQTLQQHIIEFLTEFNLEEKVDKFKTSLRTFAHEFPITTEDLEAAVSKLRTVTEEVMAKLITYGSEVQELILSGSFTDTIMQKVTSLNEQYDIKGTLLAIIEAIENVINQIDLTKIEVSSIPIFYDVDKLNVIKSHLQHYVADLKHVVTEFDKARFMEQMQNIIATTEMYTEHLINIFSRQDISKIVDTLKQLIIELDIVGRGKAIYNHFKEVFIRYELDIWAEKCLDKLVELIKLFKIDENIRELGSVLEIIDISCPYILKETLTYLKTTDINQIIGDLNKIIEAFINSLKSFDYNIFIDDVNQMLSEHTEELNIYIASFELPQKLETAEELMNCALSSTTAFLKQLRQDIKTIAEKYKQDIIDMDIRRELKQFLHQLKEIHSKVLSVLTNAFSYYIEVAIEVTDQEIVNELKQIIVNVVKALRAFEIEIPNFTVPLTDLVVPSWKFSLQQLQELEFPAEFKLPSFTILGSYTVPAITVNCDDITDRLIKLIHFIIGSSIEIFDNIFDIEKLAVHLPDLSTYTLRVDFLPQISLPSIPKLNYKPILDILIPHIPEIQLPKITNTLLLPALGKFQGRFRVNSPIYVLSTVVEVQNSTDTDQMHRFLAMINSVAESSSYNILNYNLDATLLIGLPRMSRVIIADTLKFIHSALTVDHQASVTLYGLSAQATAKTIVTVTTTPYTADINNRWFFAVESGMSASFDTTYNHRVNIPFLSLTSVAALAQSVVILQKDATIQLKVGNKGTGTFDLSDFSDEATHNSDLLCTFTPTSIILTFTGDTDSATIKLKKTLNVEAVAPYTFGFKGRIETQSPFIKTSVMATSGMAQLDKMKIDVEATHNTELMGAVSGTLSNVVNIKFQPSEITVDIQNKGNGKLSFQEFFSSKFDLQNYYALILNSQHQRIYTAAVLRYSLNKYSYNFTIENNNIETGIYAAVKGETDLEFLTRISTPEIVIPGTDLTIPAIDDVNLYKATGLKYLYTTRPTVDITAKLVCQKKWISLIPSVPSPRILEISNIISEISFKSSIFNLNVNAGLDKCTNLECDVVFHIAATSSSIFEELNTKLEGSSSLIIMRGLKLANSYSLNNAYIDGTHNSTLTENIENVKSVVAMTTVNMKLPILHIEVNHKLLADTKTNPNAASTLTIKQKFDFPLIKAVGSGAIEHILKLDGVDPYISVECTTKGTIDGRFLETGIVKGTLDNEASMYRTGEALRPKLKTVANINVNNGDLKVEFDVNENLEMEITRSHLYTVMNTISNNEFNIANFNTKGKHTAKATVDLAPLRSLLADIEIDLSQPSTLGDFTISEKTVVDMTLFKQKISYSTNIVSPVYITNVVFEMEGDAPIFKAVFKASSKSPAVLLEYDLDSYLSTAMENEVLKARAKAFFEHNGFTIDFNTVLTPSDPSHTLNFDITSTTFTNVNLRYVATSKGVSASVSSPSAGLLGFQLQSKIPSQLSSRLYGQYASVPGNDIEIMTINVAANGDKKIRFQADCNLYTPKEMLHGLKVRLPVIISAITNFAEQHGILGAIHGLKTAFTDALTEAYTISNNHTSDLSQLSVLFRNVIVQHQKAIQKLLNDVITFLRETQIKLPGIKESTLPEICQQIKISIVMVLEEVINTITDNLKANFLPSLKNIRIVLHRSAILTGDEILDYMENGLTYILNMIKQLESPDVILEKLNHALQETAEKIQGFIDTIQSDFLDIVAAEINTLYTRYIINLVNSLIDNINNFRLKVFVDSFMDLILFTLGEFIHISTKAFQTDPEAMVNFQNGRLKMDIYFPLYQ